MICIKKLNLKHLFACIKHVCVAAVLASCWWASAVWLESIAKDLEMKVEARKPQPSLLQRVFEPLVQWMWPPHPLPEVHALPLFERHVTAVLKIMRLKEELRQPVPKSVWVLLDYLVGNVMSASLVVVIMFRARGQARRRTSCPINTVHRTDPNGTELPEDVSFTQTGVHDSQDDTGIAAIANPSPSDEPEASSSLDTGMVSKDGPALHEVDQDTIEAFLKGAGLTSLSFSPLPLRRLSSPDKRDILGQRWLSDDVIDLAQEMLQRQFPHICGLYACGSAFTLPPLQPDAKSLFLQVVNRSLPQSLASMADYTCTAGTHWLLLSSYGATRSGELAVYDSMFENLSTSTVALVRHLQSLYVSPPGAVMWPVQQQQDCYSCGLFALAFAFSIASGQDPCGLRYDRDSMAQHLVWCLEHGVVRSFPSVHL